MRRLLQLLLSLIRIISGREAVRASIVAGEPYNLDDARRTRMEVTRRIDTGQAFDLFFRPKNRHGLPAPVDGVPQWNVEQEADTDSAVTVAVADDGLSARVTANAGTGTARRYAALVTVTGDADLGEGVRPVVAIGRMEVFVTPEEATAADLEAGEVVDVTAEPEVEPEP